LNAVTDMDDKQYKRLMRIFGTLSTLLLIVLLAILFVVIRYPRTEIERYIGQKGDPGKSAYALAVDNGYTGNVAEWLQSLKGKDGTNGLDGTNGVDGQPATPQVQVQPIPAAPTQPTPAKGERGDAGSPGRQLQITVDPLTCVLESRYEGDDTWQPLAQLQSPCEVKQ